MHRDLLPHLPIVATVARRRSFAAAAAELNLSPSAVSHAVRQIEEGLNCRLFSRTTRSVALTELGESFLARALPALEIIREAAEETRALQGQVVGVLRINAPRVAQALVMTELLREAALRHPALVIEVTSDDALVDIVAEGYDAGVRLGEMIAGDMIAVRLTPPFRAVMVASPHYLSRTPAIKRLSDLQQHNCIGFRQLSTGGTYAWELADRGRDVVVGVNGSARVTDPLFALDLALAGIGIAYLFEPLAKNHIQSGALELVLPKASIEEPGLFLYFPKKAAEAPKLRAFINVARDRLAHTD